MKRTNSLNKFYWSVLIPAFSATLIEYLNLSNQKTEDYDKNTIHSYLKERFLSNKDTKNLTEQEFTSYLESVTELIITLTTKTQNESKGNNLISSSCN